MPRTTLEIKISHYTLGCSCARRAITEAFGIDQDSMTRHARFGQPMTLLVTLEQFGLFIALRNAYGGTNSIKDLHPQLIMHPRHSRIDCTEYRCAA